MSLHPAREKQNAFANAQNTIILAHHRRKTACPRSNEYDLDEISSFLPVFFFSCFLANHFKQRESLIILLIFTAFQSYTRSSIKSANTRYRFVFIVLFLFGSFYVSNRVATARLRSSFAAQTGRDNAIAFRVRARTAKQSCRTTRSRTVAGKTSSRDISRKNSSEKREKMRAFSGAVVVLIALLCHLPRRSGKCSSFTLFSLVLRLGLIEGHTQTRPMVPIGYEQFIVPPIVCYKSSQHTIFVENDKYSSIEKFSFRGKTLSQLKIILN